MKKIKILLVGMLILLMFGLTGCGVVTVNLNDYVTVKYDGYDTLGTAKYQFDYAAFESDYEEEIKIKKKNNEIEELLYFGETPASILLETCVSQNLDKKDRLTNGDRVTLSWKCDDDIAKEYFNVKLNYSDLPFQVNGLKEIGIYKPMEHVKVSFSGTSPNGIATIVPDTEYQENYYIEFISSELVGLKNGDTITVRAGLTCSEDDFIAKFGEKIETTTETYTVEGLRAEVTKLEEIPDDLYQKMDNQLRDKYTAYRMQVWENPDWFISMDLIGNYLLNKKAGLELPYGYVDNSLYFVYRIQMHNSVNSESTYYWFGRFNNLMILEDGTVTVNIGDCVVCEANHYGLFGTDGDFLEIDPNHYWVAGFNDTESLFNKYVASMVDYYTYQSTVTE